MQRMQRMPRTAPCDEISPLQEQQQLFFSCPRRGLGAWSDPPDPLHPPHPLPPLNLDASNDVAVPRELARRSLTLSSLFLGRTLGDGFITVRRRRHCWHVQLDALARAGEGVVIGEIELEWRDRHV